MDDEFFDKVVREAAEARTRVQAQLVLGSEWTDAAGTFCGLVTADHQDPSKVRLTVFDGQGPWGHRTRDDLAALVEVVIDELGRDARVEPGCVDRILRAVA